MHTQLTPGTFLQEFRKEAIHRQMLEYKRLASRAQRAVEDLKSERKRQDARLAAIDLSWNSVRCSLLPCLCKSVLLM